MVRGAMVSISQLRKMRLMQLRIYSCCQLHRLKLLGAQQCNENCFSQAKYCRLICA